MVKHDKFTVNLTSRNTNQRRAGTVLTQQQGDTPDENVPQSLIPGNDGQTHNVRCFNCNKWGHYASICTEPQRRTGFSSLIYGSILTQERTRTTIPHDWVLLDSCSTDCVFKNPNLVSSITKCTPQEELEMYTNGGSLVYRHMGQFNFLPLSVYFNDQSIANILSLKQVINLPGVSIAVENGPDPAIVLKYKG